MLAAVVTRPGCSAATIARMDSGQDHGGVIEKGFCCDMFWD